MSVRRRMVNEVFDLNERRPFAKPAMAISVGGGMAPGLNTAAVKAAEAAFQRGVKVIGFVDGAAGMRDGRAIELTPELISGLEFEGGIAIGTSRYQPKDEEIPQILDQLQRWNIFGCVKIGGDDTNKLAKKLAEAGKARGKDGFRTIGIPKTIDNDVNITRRCFGISTVVNMTATLLRGMTLDAEGQDVVAVSLANIMGRTSGSWTLEAGLTSGADIILIPEMFSRDGIGRLFEVSTQDFPKRDVLLGRIARVLEVNGEALETVDGLRGAIDKENVDINLNPTHLAEEIARIVIKRHRGQAATGESKAVPPIDHTIIAQAEGLAGKLPTKPASYDGEMRPTSFEVLGLGEKKFIGVDPNGHPRLSAVQLSGPMIRLIGRETKESFVDIKGVPVEVGYLLRGLDPNAEDRKLAGGMGTVAANALLAGKTGMMVTASSFDEFELVAYEDIPFENGKMIPRLVDCGGDTFINAMVGKAF